MAVRTLERTRETRLLPSAVFIDKDDQGHNDPGLDDDLESDNYNERCLLPSRVSRADCFCAALTGAEQWSLRRSRIGLKHWLDHRRNLPTVPRRPRSQQDIPWGRHTGVQFDHISGDVRRDFEASEGESVQHSEDMLPLTASLLAMLTSRVAVDRQAVDKQIPVGGPASQQLGWVVELKEHAQKTGVALDFISTHQCERHSTSQQHTHTQ